MTWTLVVDVFVGVALFAVALAALFGVLGAVFGVIDGDMPWPVGVLAVFVGVPLVVLGVWWAADVRWGDRFDGDGTHRWEGGRGPATECVYEVEQGSVLVGKVVVPTETTYTVCR